jgi:hypothetical protein
MNFVLKVVLEVVLTIFLMIMSLVELVEPVDKIRFNPVFFRSWFANNGVKAVGEVVVAGGLGKML